MRRPLWDDELVEAEGEAGRGQASVAGDDGVETLLGESRWPPVISVLLFLAFNVAVRVWLPGNGTIRVLQSTAALALFGLVVARAVNAFK